MIFGWVSNGCQTGASERVRPPGPLLDYMRNLSSRSDGSDDGCSLDDAVAPHVDTDELTDAQGVADILGVAYRNTVSVYQRRYPDMPRPVVDLGAGRPRLWLRPEIEAWAERRSAGGRRGK